MRYRHLPIEVEAIKFESSPQGIEKMKSFCGSSLGRIIKKDGKAEAEIGILDGSTMIVKQIATEGEWIVNCPDNIVVYSEEIFSKIYSRIC